MIVVGVVALVMTPVVWFMRLSDKQRGTVLGFLMTLPTFLLVMVLAWSPLWVEGYMNFRRFRSFHPRKPRDPPALS
jgi:hypothetical protein